MQLLDPPSDKSERHWASYKLHYDYRETLYHITVRRVGEAWKHVIRVTVNGAVVDAPGADGAGRPQAVIPMVDDRQEHQLTVDFG